MNTNLLNVLKQITSGYGAEVLNDSRRVKALFADLAKDEPKPQKNALLACLEHGFAAVLRDIPAGGRAACKASLAERLYREEGLADTLCNDTLDLLEAVVCGEVSGAERATNRFCTACGVVLSEGARFCPSCGAPADSNPAKSRSQPAPKNTSGSGSPGTGYGLNSTSSPKFVDPQSSTDPRFFEYKSIGIIERGVRVTKYTGTDTNVVIPQEINGRPVISIGDQAFRDCTDLTSITIPPRVTSIGVQAFKNCTGLASITIPPSVKSIYYQAFKGCTGLTFIMIPSSVYISIGAFSCCTSLRPDVRADIKRRFDRGVGWW
ncbi:MAG: leucine-rich repeat protein [Treponema sp.]|nr:leucine-rich repeat protein [Treponema sp.]